MAKRTMMIDNPRVWDMKDPESAGKFCYIGNDGNKYLFEHFNYTLDTCLRQIHVVETGERYDCSMGQEFWDVANSLGFIAHEKDSQSFGLYDNLHLLIRR